MIVARLLAAAAALLLALAILWAAGEASIIDSVARISADPWGVVTLVDLYAGLLLFAIVVVVTEPSRPVAIAVVLLSPVLGNLVPAVWLIARLPRLAARLRAP